MRWSPPRRRSRRCWLRARNDAPRDDRGREEGEIAPPEESPGERQRLSAQQKPPPRRRPSSAGGVPIGLQCDSGRLRLNLGPVRGWCVLQAIDHCPLERHGRHRLSLCRRRREGWFPELRKPREGGLGVRRSSGNCPLPGTPSPAAVTSRTPRRYAPCAATRTPCRPGCYAARGADRRRAAPPAAFPQGGTDVLAARPDYANGWAGAAAAAVLVFSAGPSHGAKRRRKCPTPAPPHMRSGEEWPGSSTGQAPSGPASR
jgi:hypothetical protein